MSTNEARGSPQRLPEYTPRLDWAKPAPEAFQWPHPAPTGVAPEQV
ncbi:hypothetical protein [Streptomyces sp. NPDC054783]